MATIRTTRARLDAHVIFALALVALLGFGAATTLSAQEEFGEAELFFELNNTDGDLGIHAVIDGAGWEALDINGPIAGGLTGQSHFDDDATGTLLLNIRPQGTLRRHGLTQLSFESTEPPFDELAPAVFFKRFPEGTYAISGRAVTGARPRNLTEVTHAMPAPPRNLRVNGIPLPQDCEEGPVPMVSGATNILIEWDPVQTTHPALGSPRGSDDIEIDVYEVFVDQDDFGLAVDQDPTDTDFLVPAGLLVPGETLVEILVREASHNQTASESCFTVE